MRHSSSKPTQPPVAGLTELAAAGAGVVGIVAALEAEARPLDPPARRRGGLAALADGTMLAVSGIGRAAAAQAARALVAAGCRALASWGLAGGLDPALACGAILLPEEVMLEGRASLRTAAAWREPLERALETRWPVIRGNLLTSGRALGTVAQKAAAFRDTNAAAVDMESFAVGEVAMAQGVPFIAVRVIVDTAADELPAALADVADTGAPLSIGRLVGGVIAEPSGIGSLLRLARRYRAARRALRGIALSGALTACAPVAARASLTARGRGPGADVPEPGAGAS